MITLNDCQKVSFDITNGGIDFDHFTAQEASAMAEAFVTVVELSLKAAAITVGKIKQVGDKYVPDIDFNRPEDVALAKEVISNTGLVKTILAVSNNKLKLTSGLVSGVARVAATLLQDVGDSCKLENDKISIKLTKYETVTDSFAEQADEIRKLAGNKVTVDFENDSLKGCFKEISGSPINPSGCNAAIVQGLLDPSLKTTKRSTDIRVDISYRVKEE